MHEYYIRTESRLDCLECLRKKIQSRHRPTAQTSNILWPVPLTETLSMDCITHGSTECMCRHSIHVRLLLLLVMKQLHELTRHHNFQEHLGQRG